MSVLTDLFKNISNSIKKFGNTTNNSPIDFSNNINNINLDKYNEFTYYYAHIYPVAFNSALTWGRSYLTATSNSNYAIIAGGGYSSLPGFNTSSEYISQNLTLSTTNIGVARHKLASASIGNYAIIAGGYNDSGMQSYVDAFNSSMSRSVPTALSVARRFLGGGSNSNYAIFGGGYNGSYLNTVDAYNSSLTRSNPTVLSSNRSTMGVGCVNKNYCIFAGGNTEGESKIVDAYNTSLVRSIPTQLINARYNIMGGSSIPNAIFYGGTNNAASYTNYIEFYNSSLTRKSSIMGDSYKIQSGASASNINGRYILFGGGTNISDSTTSSKVLYIRNDDDGNIGTSLNNDWLKSARSNLAGTVIGDYKIFAGGSNSTDIDIFLELLIV